MPDSTGTTCATSPNSAGRSRPHSVGSGSNLADTWPPPRRIRARSAPCANSDQHRPIRPGIDKTLTELDGGSGGRHRRRPTNQVRGPESAELGGSNPTTVCQHRPGIDQHGSGVDQTLHMDIGKALDQTQSRHFGVKALARPLPKRPKSAKLWRGSDFGQPRPPPDGGMLIWRALIEHRCCRGSLQHADSARIAHGRAEDSSA